MLLALTSKFPHHVSQQEYRLRRCKSSACPYFSLIGVAGQVFVRKHASVVFELLLIVAQVSVVLHFSGFFFTLFFVFFSIVSSH
jgi:hypothetical protein